MQVLILFCVVAAAFGSPQCGKNEHYESCGTACPLTCENYDNPPQVCVLRCDMGCFCDDGYVRSSDGRCIKPEQCPSRNDQCGKNEHYESCGTACPLTCENYDNPPQVCVLRCDMGCFCDDGYVRSSNGRCVKPEQCPSRNEPVVKTCLEEADAGMCLAYMPQWYYDAEKGQCFEFVYGGCQGNGNRYATEEECLSHCGKVCGENKVYKECGSACPLTCDNYDNPPKICPAMCVSGCHCEKDYVKTRDGRCVRPENCPA